MSARTHWQKAWEGADPKAKSWFQDVPARALEMIEAAAIARNEAVIDVGGGASTLVDALLARGFADISVLDISEVALQAAQARLEAGPQGATRAQAVTWLCADACAWRPAHRFRLWHDRAVFHFLTAAEDRARYCAIARDAIVPGGYLVIATFASDGPQKCSGLPVRRYDAAALAAAFTPGFDLVDQAREHHTSPAGAIQHFQYCLLRRTPYNSCMPAL